MVLFNVFDARDLLAFPGGDNATDTVFAGVHFNRSTLAHWNYTLYSNQTLSNGSDCWLTFEPYQPQLLYTNGTFVNATACWSAIDPIGTRGYTGIALAVVYGVALVLTLAALAKHGALYLPKETRFYPIGRRWQWYWACFVCACALVSLFTNIDVDRYYLQHLPIIVTTFFWFLLCQGTLALTWEAVRHWGSWLERQFIDPNPFVYHGDDRRAMIEFWLPLWFYFWVWMNFFLAIPRDWTFAEMQRSPDQTLAEAVPVATGARFKAAAFCLVVAWLTIVFSLRHSVKHYKPRNRGIVNRAVGLARAVPLRFFLILPLSLVLIAYQALMAFEWRVSLIRYDGLIPVIFACGYGPPLLILYIQIAYGFASPNEDKELMRQRRQRGDVVNRELGIVKKPAWWRRVRGDHAGTLRDEILRNVREVGGERRRPEAPMEHPGPDAPERPAAADIELGSVPHGRYAPPPPASYVGKSERRHAETLVQTAAGVLFPSNAGEERARHAAYLMELDDEHPPPYSDGGRTSTAQRNSTSTTNSASAPPQQVRSMLDV